MKNKVKYEKDNLVIEFPHYFTMNSNNWHDKQYKEQILKAAGIETDANMYIPPFVDKM